MKRMGWLLLLALASTPVLAQIHVDYDKNVDFQSYKTFAFMEKDEMTLKTTSPLMHERIVAAIRTRLQSKGGLTEVPSNPDVWVTYHTSTQEELQLNTTSFGYGYGPGWYWDPYWTWGPTSTTTSVYSYTRGTLILDVWDAKTKQLIFRGSGSEIVPENPEKGAKLIDKTVNKIGDKFRKMYAKDQKAKAQG